MTRSCNRTRRGVLSVLAIAGMSVFVLAGGVGRAQEATPAPPAAPAMPCAEVLGVGAAGDACVNIIHASPDAPSVDIMIDDATASENLAFGAATGWMALPAGEHLVQVVPTGQMVDVAVIDATVDLEPDRAYEVAAIGQIDVIQAGLYPVDLTISGDDANAAVRVIHASPDAPAVDVAEAGGDVLIGNLAYPANSDYLVVPAGTYDFEARSTGTADVVLPVPAVEVAAGNAYSFYAIGTVADGTITVLPIVAGAPMAVEATPLASPPADAVATPVG